MKKHNILFVCSQNKLRSPTAECIYSTIEELDVDSAGTDHGAKKLVNEELVEWASRIVCMETKHALKIRKKFGHLLKNKRIIIVNIPDEYEYMDPGLIFALRAREQAWMPSEIYPAPDDTYGI